MKGDLMPAVNPTTRARLRRSEGGLDARGQPDDTRTAAQKKTMRHLLEDLHERYPRAMIVGHRDLSHDRDCPCFDAYKEYADLQPK